MNGDSPTPGRDPNRSRPTTQASYGIPDRESGMLKWTFVEDHLAGDRSYWITTVRPDGFPHVRPTWGVWVDGSFHCGGGERTRWVRNLAVTPAIVVNRADTESVVIIEGTAERIDDDTADPARIERLDSAYESKYHVRHGTPFFAVRPDTVFAWSEFPTDATRWRFPQE